MDSPDCIGADSLENQFAGGLLGISIGDIRVHYELETRGPSVHLKGERSHLVGVPLSDRLVPM
ncbi:MAG: hypothetical protein ABJA82_05055 [Myxococcales bacterium]